MDQEPSGELTTVVPLRIRCRFVSDVVESKPNEFRPLFHYLPNPSLPDGVNAWRGAGGGGRGSEFVQEPAWCVKLLEWRSGGEAEW